MLVFINMINILCLFFWCVVRVEGIDCFIFMIGIDKVSLSIYCVEFKKISFICICYLGFVVSKNIGSFEYCWGYYFIGWVDKVLEIFWVWRFVYKEFGYDYCIWCGIDLDGVDVFVFFDI